MSEYTPTTEQVRQLYANSMDPAGFDRWLAAEKAKWQAEGAVSVLRQAANLAEPLSGADLPSSPSRPMFADWLRDRADHIARQGASDV